MANMLFVIWGIALLAILVLGGIVLWAQRSAQRSALSDAPSGMPPLEVEVDKDVSFGPVTDTLLLYYEEQGVRSTPSGDVVLRIPGMAWEREWQEDLVRLEVSTVDPSSVAMPEEWGEARVLSAYALRAYRMTEIGTDIPVERFAAPIDVFLTTEGEEEGLRFGVSNEGTWTLAPPAALSLDALEGADVPAARSWVAASVAGLRQVCLVRLASEGGDSA